MAWHQLVYSSRPFGFDEAMLNGILMDARRFNPEHDITGALICRHDLFMQLLEGPEAAVQSLYRRICKDDRHLETRKLVDRTVERRMFPNWAMRSDPAQSWLWSAEDVSNGAIQAASTDDVIAVFERVADLVQS